MKTDVQTKPITVKLLLGIIAFSGDLGKVRFELIPEERDASFTGIPGEGSDKHTMNRGPKGPRAFVTLDQGESCRVNIELSGKQLSYTVARIKSTDPQNQKVKVT